MNAQEPVEIPITLSESPDSHTVQTIKLEFEQPKTSRVDVRYENIIEKLSEEQINCIITNLEERSDASVEMFQNMEQTMVTLNTILEDKAFMQNKVIYQADYHYDLSESEVKRALRGRHLIDMVAYIIILIYIMFAARNIKRRASISDNYVDLYYMATATLALSVEILATWFVVRPLVSIVLNGDYEIIKFLLQGA